MKKLTLAAMFALAAFALQVSAKTYYVKAEGGVDVDPKVQKTAGLSEGAAFATIQFAIDNVAAGSTILVYPGEYGAIKSNNKKLTIKAVEGLESVIVLPSGEYAWTADLGAWGTQQLYGTAYQFSNKKWSSVCIPWRIESWLPGVDWDDYDKYGASEEDIIAEAVALGDYEFENDYWMRNTKSVAVKGLKYDVWKGGKATKLFGLVICGGDAAVAGGTLESCAIRGASKMAANESSLTDCVIEDCSMPYEYATQGYWGTHGGVLVDSCTLTRCKVIGNLCNMVSLFSTLNNSLVHRNNGDTGGQLICCSTLYNCTVVDNAVGSWIDEELVFVEDESGEYDEEYGTNGYWASSGGTSVYGVALGYGCKAFDTIVYNNDADDGLQHNVDTNDFFDTTYTYVNAKGKTVTTRYDADSQFVNSCTDVLVDSSKNKKVKSTGNIAADPCFIAPERGDYRLAPWSQCVNKGADYQSKTGKLDLDGLVRKVGGKVDMGVYELQASTPVPADYDGDGVTDAALYFADSGTWWIWGSQEMLAYGVTVLSLPAPKGATPIAADFDESGLAQPGYFAGAEKAPFFVYCQSMWNDDVTTNAFPTYTDASGKAVSTKGAIPVAAKFTKDSAKATFGIYASTAKVPVYSFLGTSALIGGDAKVLAKSSKPVVADFDGDGKDDLGAYTASASKPAFTVLESGSDYSTKAPFKIPSNFFYPTDRTSVALGAKNSIPCCADFDGDGKADFATYSSTASAPEFTRLFSTSKYSETRTLQMGNKGDVPVVGVYEAGQSAAPAVWTGSVWTYLGADWGDKKFVGK